MTDETKNDTKQLTVYDLEEMIKELAMAHDQIASEVKRLQGMLAQHQHNSQGQAMFPLEE